MSDLITGAFELLGGVFVWLNVVCLHRVKQVHGVDWRSTAFFTFWSAWNLFYYPHLTQWAAFGGGLILFLANAAWLLLVLRYR